MAGRLLGRVVRGAAFGASLVAVPGQRRFARGAERVALAPLRPAVAAGDLAAHGVKHLEVLGDAAVVPVLSVLDGRRGVVVGGVVLAGDLARVAAALEQGVAALGV